MTKKKKIRGVAKKNQHKKPLPPAGRKRFRVFFEKLSPKQFNLLAIIAIIIVGYLSYSNSLNGEMIFDDFNIIKLNNKIHNLDDFKNVTKWINPNHRHFAMFTYAMNYSIHENNVFGYHLFNLIIHIIYACFVFLLARLILSISIFDNIPQRKHAGLMAFFIALICVVHPIQTQAVSYIVQRMASMAGMFYIMSLYFYVKGRLLFVKNRLNTKVILLYLFAFLGGLLGLVTKQTVVTLPFAILLVEIFFIRNKEGAIFKKYIVISFSLILLFVAAIIWGGYLPKETETITRSEYLQTQFRVIVKYIQLLLLPVNQALDYDYKISRSLFELKVMVSSFIVLSLIIAAFLLYKKKHLISFGIFWFFLTLSVESSIIPIRDVIFEHRLYLPMFGFSLVIFSLIYDLFAKKRLYAVIVFFLVLNIIYGVATYERNKVWESGISIWSDNIDKYPGAVSAYVNRGFSYNQNGKYQEAIADCNTGMELDSNNYKLYFNKGISHKRLKQYGLAIIDFSMAIEKRKVNDYQPYLERGIIYTDNLNQYDQGIKDFMTILSQDPNHANSTLNLAVAYFKKGIFDSAMVYGQRAIDIYPENGTPYYITAAIYADRKDFRQAYEYAINARSLGYPVQETLIKEWNNRASEEISAGNEK